MREFGQSFSKQVDDFLNFYPSYIEHVKPELNGLFREEDYPSADALRKKFALNWELIRLSFCLGEEEIASIPGHATYSDVI